MSKSEIYRKRVQKGERPSQGHKGIMTPFELINPQDYDRVITELQKQNKELKTELLEASGLIEEWSSVHSFDDWNRSEKYRKIANKELE